ncbi:hypothetical protein, partial [Azospirillum brasilense]|uniref:hypothetical protein n=1 Tax=Azospirillum brasilense TaxID=192 RepID=UPI001B3B6E17
RSRGLGSSHVNEFNRAPAVLPNLPGMTQCRVGRLDVTIARPAAAFVASAPWTGFWKRLHGAVRRNAEIFLGQAIKGRPLR